MLCIMISLIEKYLLNCSDDVVENNVFEEFDGNSISFLSDILLQEFMDKGLISKEVCNMVIKLRDDFRKLEKTKPWNVESIKNISE